MSSPDLRPGRENPAVPPNSGIPHEPAMPNIPKAGQDALIEGWAAKGGSALQETVNLVTTNPTPDASVRPPSASPWSEYIADTQGTTTDPVSATTLQITKLSFKGAPIRRGVDTAVHGEIAPIPVDHVSAEARRVAKADIEKLMADTRRPQRTGTDNGSKDPPRGPTPYSRAARFPRRPSVEDI